MRPVLSAEHFELVITDSTGSKLLASRAGQASDNANGSAASDMKGCIDFKTDLVIKVIGVVRARILTVMRVPCVRAYARAGVCEVIAKVIGWYGSCLGRFAPLAVAGHKWEWASGIGEGGDWA